MQSVNTMTDTPQQLLNTKELLENLKNDLECSIALPSLNTFYQEEALKKVKSLEVLLND